MNESYYTIVTLFYNESFSHSVPLFTNESIIEIVTDPINETRKETCIFNHRSNHNQWLYQ